MKKTIRNLVFDMGEVLIHFEPDCFIRRLGITGEADRRLLAGRIFYSSDWPLLDLGELTEATLEERVKARLPEKFHDAAHELIFHWDEPLIPVAGMADLIRDCKQAGYHLYLLSNASVRQKEFWPRIPGSEYFDGRIVSAEHLLMKPMPEIYRLLFDRYHLNPGECFFVDDVRENLDAAAAEGMEGFLFRGNVQELRDVLLPPSK